MRIYVSSDIGVGFIVMLAPAQLMMIVFLTFPVFIFSIDYYLVREGFVKIGNFLLNWIPSVGKSHLHFKNQPFLKS